MTAVATPAVDLAAYFRRIGYSGETAPTLDVLRAIHLRHAQTIAFESEPAAPLAGTARPGVARAEARAWRSRWLLLRG